MNEIAKNELGTRISRSKSQSVGPDPPSCIRFCQLSAQRQVLVRLYQMINYGEIRDIEVRSREPVFGSASIVLVDVRLDSTLMRCPAAKGSCLILVFARNSAVCWHSSTKSKAAESVALRSVRACHEEFCSSRRSGDCCRERRLRFLCTAAGFLPSQPVGDDGGLHHG